MSQASVVSGTQLTNALHVLGIKFILGGNDHDRSLHKRPARLIAALASSREGRLRLALIPLFLEHPEFAGFVCSVTASLNPSARLTLQFYYSAAVWLQQKYRARLESDFDSKPSLPDYFSHELGIQKNALDPQANLVMLAERQRVLSGENINWLGTYQHAALIWSRGLQIQNA